MLAPDAVIISANWTYYIGRNFDVKKAYERKF